VIQWNEQVADGAVVLCVNQRLARYHQAQFSQWQLQQSRVCWETPAIHPLRGWLVSLYGQALAQGLVTKSLVPDLLSQQAWQRIIDDDSQVTLLDSGLATELARQSWQLSQAWQCFNQDDQYLSNDQYTWQRWMKAYCQWLDAQQAIDEPLLPSEVSALLGLVDGTGLNALAIQQLLPKQIILDGFLQLSTQLQNLVDALTTAGVEVSLTQPQANAVVHPLPCANDDEELLLIATQMRHELAHDSRQSLGLVVPDLNQRRAAVLRTFDRVFFPGCSPDQITSTGRPYDFSLGNSLSEQAVVAAALLQLKLCFAQLSGAEISALLLSPYWKGAEQESSLREQLDRRLRENRVNVALTALQKKSVIGTASLTHWANAFSTTLRQLGWPTSSLDTEEFQAVASLFECFDDLQRLDDGENTTVLGALSQFKSLISRRLFQVDTPERPIQIMGRLESHGLVFDCLWVAGMDAEQWPPAGSPSPFLAIEQQKSCAIPQSSAALRLQLAQTEFNLWASCSPLLVVSYALDREGNELSAATLPHIHSSEYNEDNCAARLARLQQVQLYWKSLRMNMALPWHRVVR